MPRRLTPELLDQICGAIADGASLRAVCEQLNLPRRTVRGWLTEHDDFARAYDRARKLQVDHLFDELVEIADSVKDSDSNAAVQAARLAVDTRKWIAAKLLPQRFGDQLALTGVDGKSLIPDRAADADAVVESMLLMVKSLRAAKDASAEKGEGGTAALPTSADGLMPVGKPDAPVRVFDPFTGQVTRTLHPGEPIR